MQDGPTSLIEALPPEILTDVASCLELSELTNLRLVSRTFAALSDEAFDIAWQPHLEKLKQIDPTLSVLPPKNAIAGWRQAQFKQHFIQIAQQQMAEIDHFKAYSKEGELPYQAVFVHIAEPAKTLGEVLEREQLLNQFNANLIKSKIKKNRTALNLPNTGLTRFPKQLFEDDELSSYWSTLKDLDLAGNLIKSLPDTLGDCTELQMLNCSGNQLTTLPDTLGNCTKLQMLSCSGNQLTALPDSLCNCVTLREFYCFDNRLTALPELKSCDALIWFFCSNNYLTALPDLVGSCIQFLDCSNNQLTALPNLSGWAALIKLNCSNNRLTVLPDLGGCTALQEFFCQKNELIALPILDHCAGLLEFNCSDNFIKTIPSEITARLGQPWYEETMASQKSPPVLCLDQGFNPVLFSSGVESNNPVENEGTSAPENSALVNKTFKL